MKDEVVKDTETIKIKVYAEALANLTEQSAWLALLQKPCIRRLRGSKDELVD